MIIRAQSLTKSLWKNGGGTTTEIYRSGGGFGGASGGAPSAASYEWRASFAEIASDGPFSEFPGYDRALVVIEGEGIRLDGETHLPLTPFYFSGDQARLAELIKGPVRDFGVIYKHDLFTCRLDVITTVDQLDDDLGTLLFVLKGELQIGRETLRPHDSWLSQRLTVTPRVRGTPDLCAVRVKLQRSIV